jgi:chromosome segregation ATPase
MALEDMELDVGGVKFKGIYIAILLSFATTIGGGIWAASEFVSRISNLETSFEDAVQVLDKIEPLEIDLASIKTKIEDNDLGHLQGKLAELDTLLNNIKERQTEVLADASTSTSKVIALEKDWIEVRNEYKKMADAIKQFEKDVQNFKKEVDDLWKGLDAASSPLG